MADEPKWETVEEKRLREDEHKLRYWRRWGPYLSERQWVSIPLDQTSGTASDDQHPRPDDIFNSQPSAKTTAPMAILGTISLMRLHAVVPTDGEKMVLLGSVTTTAGWHSV